MLTRGLKPHRFAAFKKLIILIIILISLAVGYFVINQSPFNIKKVEINLNKVNCVSENDLNKEINVVGKNIILLDRNLIKNSLLQKYSCMKSVNFLFSGPSALKINVSGREPVLAFIKSPTNDASVSAAIDELQSRLDSTIGAQVSPVAVLQLEKEYFLFV